MGGDIKEKLSLLQGGGRAETSLQGKVEEWTPAMPRWNLGVAEVDERLPNASLSMAALHEVSPENPLDAPAAGAFTVALLVRLLRGLRHTGRGHILWCTRGFEVREFGMLYGPGLQRMGLNPACLRIVRAERDMDILWAMEEGLGCNALAAVVGEVAEAPLTATRRLLLASEKSGVPGILLRSAGPMAPSAAHSRWRIGCAPSLCPPPTVEWIPEYSFYPAWQVELARQRHASMAGGDIGGSKPKQWNMVWNYETDRFHMAAELADRQVAPDRKAGADTETEAAG